MKSVHSLKVARHEPRSTTPSVDTVLSFVIPVYNDEEHIGNVIRAVNRAAQGIPHEIIVVDNGSTDESLRIAEGTGALCHRLPDVSIGALRNYGAAQARGEILVFVDSDVYIQDGWAATITSVIESLRRDASIITGSRYGISERPSWIERHWISPFATKAECTYLNSGHLIVHRSLFQQLGGFDEMLETGEDYKFCQRARRAGSKIVNNLDLNVMHAGNPRTFAAFFRKERWHGRGDAASFSAIVTSKPALLSIAQAMALVAAVAAALALRSLSPLLAFAAFAGSIWTVSSFRRCRSIRSAFWAGIVLYAVYFAARALAIVDVVLQRPSHRRSQPTR